MGANQTKCSRLEQKSVIKPLLAEKYKPSEVYKRICNVYRKACLSKKNVYKWAKHGFATISQS